MKQKKTNIFLSAFFMLIIFIGITTTVSAQTNLRGKVLDETGVPLTGASVLVIRTNEKTITDIDGTYHLETKEILSNKDVIVFSYIGYKNLEKKFSEGEMNVSLVDDAQILGDVVVTALGIKREEKGLGFATQKVDGTKLTDAMPINWSSALVGKVAGLNIVSVGGPIGSSRINLRGDVSLNHNNNGALIVIDGIPLSNEMTGTGDAYGAGSNSRLPVDFGNGFSDLNPDDIESIQILKGASAAALYGSRAAAGAILITTKNGSSRKEKGIGVSFNSNVSFENILRWPDYQYEFGQGLPSNVGKSGTEYDGKLYYSYGAANGNSSTSGTSSAYGARFDKNQLYFQYDPEVQGRASEATPWVAYKDNRKDLFQNGFTTTNNLSIEGKGDKGFSRFSFTHTKSEWILDNTGFQRIAASFSTSQHVSKIVSVDAKTSYTYNEIENTPGLGYNSNSLSYFLIFQNPNVNLDWLRPMWRTNQENIQQLQPYSTFINNPFITLYESINPSKKHTILSNVTTTFDINRRLKFKINSGLRMSFDEREQQRPMNDVVFGNGYYQKQNVFDYEVNSGALFSYANTFGDGIHVNANAGANTMYKHYNLLEASAIGLVTPGVYKLTNSASSPFVNSLIRNKAINSLFSSVNISYKNKIFMDITGRNDWSSTLPRDNYSFFYPSVNTSVLANELVKLPSAINLLKLRASWAQVGNDTSPYKTANYYSSSNFPGSAIAPTTLANSKLKPETSNNIELGMDFRILKNRVGLDVTYYNNVTKNQIIDVPLDATTGYSRATINAGKIRNRGFEVNLNLNPVSTHDFDWKSTITWSTNQNTILELAEGMNENQMISSVGTVSIIGTVGGSTGDLWGYKLVRNNKGEVVIDSNGLPKQAREIECVGNAYADWKWGFQNEFKYKNFRFSFSIDGQRGGKIYSLAHHKMTEQGKLEHTLNGRLPGTELYMAGDDPRIAAAKLTPLDGVYMIAPGVVENADGTYTPNSKVVTIEAYNKEYWRRANVETNSFDASFIKLREARIEYSFAPKLLAKTPFAKASIAVYGRNLAMWTDFPLFDPEAAALNGSSITPGVETGQLPSTRTYGVNLSLKF